MTPKPPGMSGKSVAERAAAGEALADPLAPLAVEIRAEVQAADTDWHGALDHARKAGALLIEAKAGCAHGEWLPWLAANFEFTTETAQGYVRLANAGTSPHLGESVNAALKALKTGEAGRDPQPAPERRDERKESPKRAVVVLSHFCTLVADTCSAWDVLPVSKAMERADADTLRRWDKQLTAAIHGLSGLRKALRLRGALDKPTEPAQVEPEGSADDVARAEAALRRLAS